MTKLFGYMTYIPILLTSILLAGILARLLSRSPRLPMRSPAGDYVTVTDPPEYAGWWN
jgi:hypothetical protein